MKKLAKSLFISLLILFVSFTFVSQVQAQKTDPKTTDQKLNTALQIIRFAYVDTVNEEKLVETAIIQMLKELDPHSVYIPKKQLQRANEGLVGNFEGVGIQFQILNDTIFVVSPVPGGPSDKLGIRAGDKIVKIDDEEATGPKVNNNFVMEHLRGPKGSKVTVSIFRKREKELIDYTITRDKIPIHSIDATFMASKDIGYIKINRFARTTMEEFEESMKKLRKKGMKHLILDLRNNSGGYLATAIDLADQFLKEDKLIVYTEGRFSPRTQYSSSEKGDFTKGRLVILVNEGSASASEIVSGAVQDWDRGIVMGRRSFGKGLVQRPYNLPDGSVIRLTTARYYTPSGRCIQKPYENGIEDYYRDFQHRLESGELIHLDSIHFPDSLKYYTNGRRTVYGGGGIMPDIFIPLDTSQNSDYYSDLWRKSIINQFCLEYVDAKRDSLEKIYPDFTKFNKDFAVSPEFLNYFVGFAEENGVEKNEEELKTSQQLIETFIKAMIARNLFNLNASYQVSSLIDEVYLKAIKAIEDPEKFNKMKIQAK